MKIFGYPRDDFSGLHLGFPWMNIGINPERNGWRIKKKIGKDHPRYGAMPLNL
jgi:hypothetical protein